EAHLSVVPAGEEHKTLTTASALLDELLGAGIRRDDRVVAVGGGVVGDVAGFSAALALRGVRCVQVPTTLLAMVDSSVGGKTGVNTARTKNGVGAYWQPVAVVSELGVLDTLPEDQYLAAFGEIVKYAVAMDAGLAGRLEAERERLLARSPAALEPVVSRCVELKAGVVAADEREAGPREILNYGHTVGHAIEAASGYTATHGRAVAQGMRAAARLAAAMGLCEDLTVAAQDELL